MNLAEQNNDWVNGRGVFIPPHIRGKLAVDSEGTPGGTADMRMIGKGGFLGLDTPSGPEGDGMDGIAEQLMMRKRQQEPDALKNFFVPSLDLLQSGGDREERRGGRQISWKDTLDAEDDFDSSDDDDTNMDDYMSLFPSDEIRWKGLTMGSPPEMREKY